MNQSQRGDPKEVLYKFLCHCPIPFSFDGSPEYLAKGPLYSPSFRQYVRQYGTPKVRNAYDQFVKNRGPFAVNITEGGPLDVLTRFFIAHPFNDEFRSRSFKEKGLLYAKSVPRHIAQFGGLPEIEAFVAFRAEDRDWDIVKDISEMRSNPANWPVPLLPKDYFHEHMEDIEFFDLLDHLWDNVVYFKRVDMMGTFIDKFRFLGDYFFAAHFAVSFDGDKSEEDYAKSREVIRLLHGKGIDLRHQLEFVKKEIAEHKPSLRGVKKEALENVLQTLIDCGVPE
jgi:hypothetical protein